VKRASEPTSSSTALEALHRRQADFESLADMALRSERRRRLAGDEAGADEYARSAEQFAARAIALAHEIAELERA
jgi:hypothetical protein